MNGRWRSRAELLGALIGGTLLYNLHPTRLGNALTSHWSLNEGQAFEGMPLETRPILYATLCGLGALLLVAALLVRDAVRDVEDIAAAARVGAALAAAGLAGLFLDYRDGPQHTVHLVVFATVVLAVVRTPRLIHAVLERHTSNTELA